MGEWIRTDDNQAVKKITERRFEVVEAIMIAPLDAKKIDRYGISQQIVDLDDYSEKEIYDYISSFGYKSVDEMKDIYGEAANQVVAECIAESNPQEMGETFRTETKAIKYIEKEILKTKNFFCLNKAS